MITMEIDLSSIGMEKGRQYETIITTKNSDNLSNAAPIGVLYAGNDKVLSRILREATPWKTLSNKRSTL